MEEVILTTQHDQKMGRKRGGFRERSTKGKFAKGEDLRKRLWTEKKKKRIQKSQGVYPKEGEGIHAKGERRRESTSRINSHIHVSV